MTRAAWLRALPLLLLLACTGGEDPLDTGDTDDTGDTEDTGDTGDTGDTDETSVDADEDGFTDDVDCDDSDPDVNPDAPESCNGIDDDCDELVDDADPDIVDAGIFYEDADQDGFGADDGEILACDQPPGTALEAGDCDDATGAVYPGADEICDGQDNDCDALVDDLDDDVVDPPTWWADGDMDGFGDPALPTGACEAPEGHVDNDLDCDDGDVLVGEAVPWWLDGDGDGYGGTTTTVACDRPVDHVDNDQDCDDGDFDISPDADEVCDGGVDNDCNGVADDRDSGVVDPLTWYVDDDDDGYGDPDAPTTAACVAPSGYVEDDTDCDDSDHTVHPTRFDFDDDKDNDCDTSIDEDVGSETTTHDSDIQTVWNTHCTRCHGSSGGLSLTSSAWSKIVDVRSGDIATMDLVEPGDPRNSYLWRKVEGTHLGAGGSGSTMPIGGSLSSSELDDIETWILEGAVR